MVIESETNKEGLLKRFEVLEDRYIDATHGLKEKL